MKTQLQFTSRKQYLYSICILVISLVFANNTYVAGQTYELQLNAQTYNGGYNISCNGVSDGSINLVVIGGTSPYTYLWSTGATTQNLSNLPTGTYTVTVTDAGSNTVSSEKNLTQPQILQTTLAPRDVTIYGQSNGSITQYVSGGTPPYSYLWSSGGTISALLNIPVGNYNVTVTDANGCTTQETTTISQPDQLIITVFNGTNVTCPSSGADDQGRDGSIDAEVSGGIPPYIYDWSNGAFTQDITDLSAGDYTLRVTDQGGAQTENSITITQPDKFQIEFTLSLYSNGYNVSCSECFNGSVSAIVTGGTQPYTYSWMDREIEIANTATVSNIGGGKYGLQIIDQLGCKTFKDTELREAPAKGWSRDGNAGISANEFIGTVDNTDIVFKTQTLERFRITGDGEINLNSFSGIGNRYLMVNSIGNLQFSAPSVPWETRGNDNINHQVDFIGTINAADFIIRTSDLPRMFLKANGNIGIGIDNPNEKLEVVGNIKLYSPNSDIVTVGHDGVNGFIESGTAVNGALKINFNSGENVEVLTNSTGGSFEVGHNVFLSTIDGSVGIGTKTIQQGYKLVVDGGKVGFREVYVKLLGQWPDYVFAQNYKLKPLADVEEFITNNKHLPDMPNASMIEIEGQNIGEIQRLHQLKIEEIFLYIIQLQKEIEYLKNCR